MLQIVSFVDIKILSLLYFRLNCFNKENNYTEIKLKNFVVTDKENIKIFSR